MFDLNLSLLVLCCFPFIFMKCQDSCEVLASAGDLSDEVDEVHLCDIQARGEEKGYEADSESNPDECVQLEEGSTTHTHTQTHARVHTCAVN